MSRPRGTVLMNGVTLRDIGINPDTGSGERGRYVCPKPNCGRRFTKLSAKKKHVRKCDV